MLDSFYRGRRVCVTGHTGFKGGWLSDWLTFLGARVQGISLDPPSSPNYFNAVGLADRVIDARIDIREAKAVSAALASFEPEIVFHLAAQPLVRRSYAEAVETFDTNVMGTARILEAVRATPSVRVVVVVTSDKCYENREWPWAYRENDPMGGHDPYSASKGCCELLVNAWRRSFFQGPSAPRLASARAGNVIGGGDWGADRLVPDCVRAFGAGETLRIRSPQAVRPWQHVLEAVSGYLLLARRLWDEPRLATGWNFGPVDPDSWTVEHVVRQVAACFGRGEYCVDAGEKLHEAHWLRLDASRAVLELGWRPRLSVAEAIAMTMDWHKAHARGESACALHALTMAQIEAYCAR